MGTPAFAVPTLEAVHAASHEIACVYTQPPRPAGRGHKRRRSAVHESAERLGLAVRTPETFKDPETQRAFAALGCDAAVVAAYGLILPRAVLAAPRLGCLNVHPSLLPRWRGPAPIPRAIAAGDNETGVTIMRLDEGVDSGPILLMARAPIAPETTAGDLHDRLAELGARLMIEALDGVARGRLTPTPQPAEGASHAAKFDRAERRLDWRRPALALDRLTRALAPRPGAWIEIDGEAVRVLAARAVAGAGAPGTLLDAAFTVACGEGALELPRVQRPGRAAVAGAAYLRGARLAVGRVLASPCHATS